MAPQEKELTTILLGRLTKTEGQKNPEAEALIRQATAEILGASYYLVQTGQGQRVLLLVHGVLRGSVDARKGYRLTIRRFRSHAITPCPDAIRAVQARAQSTGRRVRGTGERAQSRAERPARAWRARSRSRLLTARETVLINLLPI